MNFTFTSGPIDAPEDAKPAFEAIISFNKSINSGNRYLWEISKQLFTRDVVEQLQKR
jgi:hypothetical protein